jgi:hypothetical protein
MKPIPNPFDKVSPGDAWRQCPKCHGVQVLSGNPTLKPEALVVRFLPWRVSEEWTSPTFVACSNCRFILPSQ